MTETELAKLLGGAGLRLLGSHRVAGVLPVKAAWLIVSCTREDGRRDLIVERDDPQLCSKANAAWFQLASESGLLGEQREFLLGIDFANSGSAPVLQWVKVQLMHQWDVMGKGAESGLLGSRSLYPEFVMMSLDETIVLRGTTWERGIGVLTLSDPDRVQMIRTYVERLAVNPRTESGERAMAEGWLETHPQPGAAHQGVAVPDP